MISFRTVLLSAAVFSLAAATSSFAAPMPAGPQFVSGPNACNVLTDASAKKLLGPSAKLLRKAQLNPYMSQCQYTSSNGQITVVVGDWKMIHTANPMDKPLHGLGDEAYNTPGELAVRKGAVGMTISVIVQSGEFWGTAADNALVQMSAAEKKVAVEVLPKL